MGRIVLDNHTVQMHSRRMAQSIAIKMSERDIMHLIRDMLKYSGWFIIRNQQNLGSHKGLSDLTIIREGRVIFIECKTYDGRQSDHQKKFEHDVNTHGGEYRIVRSPGDIVDLVEPRLGGYFL